MSSSPHSLDTPIPDRGPIWVPIYMQFYRSACKLVLEGVVSKRLDAPYVPGNRGLWRKTKPSGLLVALCSWLSCSGAIEQRASRTCDHADRRRLPGRGRRVAVGAFVMVGWFCWPYGKL